MAVELVKDGGQWSLVLSGEVAIGEARALHGAARATLDESAGDVVLRMGDLQSLDTSTMQVLVALGRALTERGRALRIDEAPEAVAQQWRRAGLGDLFLVASEPGKEHVVG